MEKKKVFIASSKEAYEKGIVTPILEVLTQNNFEHHSWILEFPISTIILEQLFEIAGAIDFALCLFTEDMQYLWRGQANVGTAWNVILEYGFFLQRLGRDRVTIIREGSAHIPTDLGGLVVGNVQGQHGIFDKADLESDLRKVTTRIMDKWRQIPSLHKDIYGINGPIITQKALLDRMLNEITGIHGKQWQPRYPLKFDETLIVELYTHGLENVGRRFWTTTYLSSGFWVHKTPAIYNANIKMLSRLTKAGSKDVRRLFLLKQPLEEEIEILNKKLVDYRNRRNGKARLDDLKREFQNLHDNCVQLKAYGCEIRYVHDSLFGGLISENIIPGDTELAIYDDFRIDFYEGARTKKISSVRIFSDHHHDFDSLLNNADHYFNQLWNQAGEIEDLLRALDRTMVSFEHRVDYTVKKLMDFDHNSNKPDAALKSTEEEALKRQLRNNSFRSKKIRYLDVGTCTGRYPFLLKEFFRSDSSLCGIDIDQNCIEYIQVKRSILLQAGHDVAAIDFRRYDFVANEDAQFLLGTNFDVITCMLGTISHFGRNISPYFKDDLQFALKKMKDLLHPNGILVISNWTNNGIQNGLLSIYNEHDKELLERCTEPRLRIEHRLNEVGLIFVAESVGIGKELDMFVCRHK